MASARRKARIERVTKETAVNVNVNLDGTGKTHVKTRLSFIDHLITSIGKHAMIDITLNGESNDDIVPPGRRCCYCIGAEHRQSAG